MLDNVDCPAAPVFLSTRRNVPVPISPAATRNPYKYLYGFVEAAGLFPTVNYSDKGVATPTMYSMASRKISGNNSSRKWIKLCSVVRYEGYLSSGLIEVSGGSNYVSPPSLVYISFSNQSVGSVAKNTIHSPGTELSCSFGYNYSDDGTLNIYMYTAAYNSHIYLRVVNEYVPNTIKVSGEILSSEPSGITLLQ